MLSDFGHVPPKIYSKMEQEFVCFPSLPNFFYYFPLPINQIQRSSYEPGLSSDRSRVRYGGLHIREEEGHRSCSLVGDTVVDATCGNGHDTLAMVNMVSETDKSHGGHVYAMDIQETALKNTMSLLDASLHPNQKEIVKLFATCHSEIEQVVPKGATVRVVAFNLGYLPGGDKTVITKPETTLLGMMAASRVVISGGVISMLVYVGHPGGMDEYEKVETFACGLAVDAWICCKLQMLNRPLAPVLFLLCKR